MWQKSIIAFCAVCNSSPVDNYIPLCEMVYSMNGIHPSAWHSPSSNTYQCCCMELLSTSWFSMVLNANSLSLGTSLYKQNCEEKRKKKQCEYALLIQCLGWHLQKPCLYFTGKQWQVTSLCVFNCRTSLVCLLTPVLLNSK